MTAYHIKNVTIFDAIDDTPYPGEVLIEGNRIAEVAKNGAITAENGAEVIDGGGKFLMPGMVEGHCHLSFVGPARNQDLGEIPPEEHLLRTMRNATFILNHGFTSCYSAASAKLRHRRRRAAGDRGRLSRRPARYKAAGPEITVTGGLGDERKNHTSFESFGMIADGVDEIPPRGAHRLPRGRRQRQVQRLRRRIVGHAPRRSDLDDRGGTDRGRPCRA